MLRTDVIEGVWGTNSEPMHLYDYYKLEDQICTFVQVKEVVEEGTTVSSEPFDYEAWSTRINTLFSEVNKEESRVLAQDQAYLAALKQRINENIKSRH